MLTMPIVEQDWTSGTITGAIDTRPAEPEPEPEQLSPSPPPASGAAIAGPTAAVLLLAVTIN
jgi:hypothetical protein